jgi:hypothetical protein
MRYLFLMITLCQFAATVAGASQPVGISVHERYGVILAEGSVEGHPTTFIVDTGASVTMIDAAILQTPFEKRASRFRENAPGIEVRGTLTEVHLAIGNEGEARRKVAAVDFTEIRRVYGKEVGGVLGQDYLRRFGRVSIDFEAGRLYFGEAAKESPIAIEAPLPSSK